MLFAGLLPKVTEVDPEVINGLLTVSGVILAFQPTYFGKPKRTFYKILFAAIFMGEILLLGLSGLSYVQDISTIGYPSKSTLFASFGSLTYNIIMTGFFVLVDLFVVSSQRKE